MADPEVNRFEPFDGHEKMLLAFAITVLLGMELMGTIDLPPMPASVQLRDLPILTKLMNEIGGPYEATLDPEIIARLTAVLDQRAAEEKDSGEEDPWP